MGSSSQLVIVKEDYFQNVLNVANFERWYFSLLLSETPAENPLEDWKVRRTASVAVAYIKISIHFIHERK